MKIKKFHYEGHEVRGFTSSSFARREAGAQTAFPNWSSHRYMQMSKYISFPRATWECNAGGIRVGRAVRALGNSETDRI